MSQKKKDRESAYRTIQLITLLYGAVFFLAISLGYYLLFGGSFVGALIGVVAALIAVSIAKLIGSEEKGIGNNVPLFVTLLILSAVGVFNSLMLNFEGRQLFSAAIKSAEAQVENLGFVFTRNAPDNVRQVGNKIDYLNGLVPLLIAEILNRNNCGQGPKAGDILDTLEKELKGFKRLSQGNGNPCAHAKELATSYQELIPKFYASQDWYTSAHYGDWLVTKEKLLDQKLGFVPEAKRVLSELQAEINNSRGPHLVQSVKPALENLDSQYRAAAALVKQVLADSTLQKHPALETELDLLSVRSVGEWSQLINLVLDNLGKATTYVYPTLAVFADWLMVYLFRQVRSRRVRVSVKSESDEILRG